MSIPLTAESGTILLIVFIAVIFILNWKNIQSYKNVISKIQYSLILLLEILPHYSCLSAAFSPLPYSFYNWGLNSVEYFTTHCTQVTVNYFYRESKNNLV